LLILGRWQKKNFGAQGKEFVAGTASQEYEL
jgi:hypothetical protein